jgi:hypothetical protein
LPHRLADLEAFEHRMFEVERLVLASVPVGKTECFALGGGMLALTQTAATLGFPVPSTLLVRADELIE